MHRPNCRDPRGMREWLPPVCFACSSSTETCSACAGRGVLGSRLPPGARYGLVERVKRQP